MYDYKNKTRNIDSLNSYMLAKTLTMFDYTGLPDTIPEIELEKILQTKGYAFITKIKGELYAVSGSFSGIPDVYGNHPTIIVNIPSMKFNKELDLNKDGILIISDDMLLGLLPLFERYNHLLAENEITMLMNNYNSRIQLLMSADDDVTKESAENFLKKIIAGDFGVIAEDSLFNGLQVHNAQQGAVNNVSGLIELNQYLKATLLNEVGLNANFNMKRERLNSSEVDMNTEQLRPLIDNMRKCRQRAIEKLNDRYDLNVSVQFGSVWKMKDDDPQEIGAEIGATDGAETETETGQTETEETQGKINFYHVGGVVNEV